MRQIRKQQNGFTLVELIIVIVILGILSIVAAPRFIDISRDAKVSALEQIAGQIKSTAQLARYKAIIKGLSPSAENPSETNEQTEYLVDFGFGTAEVDWGSLCPESIAELGDSLEMLDFMDLSFDDSIQTRVDNQYTLIGYDVPSSGVPTNQGCYIIYDSHARPNCTVEVVTSDC
jgi:MSHA pilin protein MshA